MGFKKGMSGNPRGRPVGSSNQKKLRDAISKDIPEIIESLTTAAKGGDVGAAKILLAKALPDLKATDQHIKLPLTGDIADDGRAALAALAGGAITPSEGAQILASITSLQRVLEGSEILERLDKLEAAIHDKPGTQQAD
ncbi:MAG: DUF5681 domain-containing protein [Chromatiaceae bacterium]|nr:DUF5681 domain-containing protein [Chromatiaceae bacterium]MCF8002665.1 DUF5681 domain-containing protein [Chromatiaceae bacterium]